MPVIEQRAKDLLNKALGSVLTKIPSVRDSAHWHKTVFAGFAPHGHYEGSYRQTDANRDCLAQNVAVPNSQGSASPGSPFDDVLADLDALEADLSQALLNLETEWSSLSDSVRLRRTATLIAATVGRFVQIHPFINGNGRMSRLLWMMLLGRFGLPLQLADAGAKRPPPPYSEAMERAMKGDFSRFTSLVLIGLRGGIAAP